MITKKQYNDIKKYLEFDYKLRMKIINEVPVNWNTITENYIKAFDQLEDVGVPQEIQFKMIEAIKTKKKYNEFILTA